MDKVIPEPVPSLFNNAEPKPETKAKAISRIQSYCLRLNEKLSQFGQVSQN
jgi:hypothetical protein